MSGKDVAPVTALRRFGLGPRPGEWQRIADDPRGFVLAAVGASTALDDAGLPTSAEAITASRRFHAELARGTSVADANAAFLPAGMPPSPDPKLPLHSHILRTELVARFDHAVATDAPFAERWVAFWSNHLCVVSSKAAGLIASAGAYEREVIRPNAFGRFHDMLAAAMRHPAILASLDNPKSVGPNSKAGLKSGRGINENLGREALELYTLGPQGGYDQADVTAFARVLTGWSIRRPDEKDAGAFVFRPAQHEPGPQTIMGKVYAEDGVDQGLAVIADIAAHPSTARHLARKLTRHFVGDAAPAAIAAAVEARWRDTGGDLAEVARALVGERAAWTAGAIKVLSPYDVLVTWARAVGDVFKRPELVRFTQTFGGRVWNPPGPNGLPDGDLAWAAPDSLANRLDLAALVAKRAEVPDVGALHAALFGPAALPATSDAVTRADSRVQALALLLMAPEFQRR
ncbi:DUF1800 domain-containing protein [Oharaeibacter diazotrophicus]|uniref:Uncharacterized protein (DUF1800 family) n=3 Tax=Oharaeibacter diazotrophicus TaxID=1920512 RepID=A0A4R6R5X8_9HYPH|nr:DUF1800 family protein [Oharaeibacter diazotrophicus]TDP80927.1 uncharacterized protein (DUF1800 family) [Oharaeibacter diazotrophicus]BBE73822.1 hypothetical protein OHA_1_03438 [Pleomorphomonas sp. SM30]GLS74694.1 hypothetical protein GCM10007904_00290 [Oharaeibacter diazotrophicus]